MTMYLSNPVNFNCRTNPDKLPLFLSFQAQEELTQEGFEDEVDKDAAISQMAKTLNALLGKLEKAEKGAVRWGSTVEPRLAVTSVIRSPH